MPDGPQGQGLRTDGTQEPSSDDGYPVHTPKEYLEELEELEALGLLEPVPKPEFRKRVRPKRAQDHEAAKPRRPRGRLGKNT